MKTKTKLLFCWLILLCGTALAQNQTVPISTIGPIRKTVASHGRDSIVVVVPPFEGLTYPSCGASKFDTTQNFPAARWSCNPPKKSSWTGFLRLSAKVIGGAASDSIRVSFGYVNDDGYFSGGNARVYAFGTSTTVLNIGTAFISNPSAISLDPARALVMDVENLNTGATRYEFWLDLW